MGEKKSGTLDLKLSKKKKKNLFMTMSDWELKHSVKNSLTDLCPSNHFNSNHVAKTTIAQKRVIRISALRTSFW